MAVIQSSFSPSKWNLNYNFWPKNDGEKWSRKLKFLLYFINGEVFAQNYTYRNKNHIGTIHIRLQHVLGGEGYPHVQMVKRSQYIRIKNPLHKHFDGMPMVGGRGQKSWKFADIRLKWMVPSTQMEGFQKGFFLVHFSNHIIFRPTNAIDFRCRLHLRIK